MVATILGSKSTYTYEDARSIKKNQYSRTEYLNLMDKKDGYSIEQMTEILPARASYVFARGATLNNPHIPASFSEKFPKATMVHQLMLFMVLGSGRVRGGVR